MLLSSAIIAPIAMQPIAAYLTLIGYFVLRELSYNLPHR